MKYDDFVSFRIGELCMIQYFVIILSRNEVGLLCPRFGVGFVSLHLLSLRTDCDGVYQTAISALLTS